MDGKRWYRDWLGWIIVVTIIYGVICLASLASDVGRPFAGFTTYYNFILNRMDIEWNTPSWWWNTVTGEAPRLGDVLIQVHDVPFDGISQPVKERALYQSLADAGHTSAEIIVLRGNELIHLTVPLRPFSWSHYTDLILFPVVVAACYWLLAIILYRASNREHKQRLVILLLCAMAILGVAVKGALFIFGSWRENILLFINPVHSLTATFIGALLIHLAFYFPHPRWQRLRRWLLPMAYGIVTILYTFFFLSKVMVWQGVSSTVAHWMDEVWFNVFQFLILLGVAFVLMRMLWEAFTLPHKSRGREEARILLIAFLLFLPVVWFAVHGISGRNDSILFLQALADTRFLALVVPFAFAAISLRYHTFAGAERWLLVALILAVSGFMANISTAVLFWQSPQLLHQLPFPPTAILLLFFLLISILWSWQSGWRGWLGRVFQWERVSYHEVFTYGQRLSAAVHPNTAVLAQRMVDTLSDALGVVQTALWLTDEGTLKLKVTSDPADTSLPAQLALPAPFPTKPIHLTLASDPWLRPCCPNMVVMLPLIADGESLGILGVGPRWDTAVFDDRDLEILDLIAQQSAIFLQNAQQTEQLSQADRQLLQIQEETQNKTAQDLHDYVLPVMAQLQLQLQTAQTLLSSDSEQAATYIEQSLAQLRDNAKVIRRIQQNLVIRPLEFGLLPYLQEMAYRFEQESGIPTTCHWLPNLDALITNTETRQAVYAVCYQALTNIQTHAQATEVTIRMHQEENKLHFTIADNGVGCAPDIEQTAVKNGHFGLRSMRIRLSSVGGDFQLQSQADAGTCIVGSVPISSTLTHHSSILPTEC